MQPKKKRFNDLIFLVLFLLTVRPLVAAELRAELIRSCSFDARSPASQSLVHSHCGHMYGKVLQTMPV